MACGATQRIESDFSLTVGKSLARCWEASPGLLPRGGVVLDFPDDSFSDTTRIFSPHIQFCVKAIIIQKERVECHPIKILNQIQQKGTEF